MEREEGAEFDLQAGSLVEDVGQQSATEEDYPPIGADPGMEVGGTTHGAAEARSEPVDAEVVEDGAGPSPELAEAVDAAVGSAELVVADPLNRHEALVAMDANDVKALITDLAEQAQANAMRKWVYKLPDGTLGLSVHGVQDIAQRMNWTGKCAIKVLPETLTVKERRADAGNGPETFFVATIFAEDARTGAIQPGVSTEPEYLQLKKATANKKREKGQRIPEDDRIFDVFAETKAVSKASRNAQAAFIPEEVEQAVLAMASQNPQLVERIQTEAEAKVAELPPPLDTPEAHELETQCATIYAEIRELGGGKGKVALTPARYQGAMMQSRHSIEALKAARAWLEQRREEIAAHYAQEASS
jgi:hypothetical protein